MFSFDELTNPSGGSQIQNFPPDESIVPFTLQSFAPVIVSQHHPPSHSVLSAQLGFVWHVCIGITIHLQMIG